MLQDPIWSDGPRPGPGRGDAFDGQLAVRRSPWDVPDGVLEARPPALPRREPRPESGGSLGGRGGSVAHGDGGRRDAAAAAAAAASLFTAAVATTAPPEAAVPKPWQRRDNEVPSPPAEHTERIRQAQLAAERRRNLLASASTEPWRPNLDAGADGKVVNGRGGWGASGTRLSQLHEESQLWELAERSRPWQHDEAKYYGGSESYFRPRVAWGPEDLLGTWVDLHGNSVMVYSSDAWEVRLTAAMSRPNRPDLNLSVRPSPNGGWFCGNFEMDAASSSKQRIVWYAADGSMSAWSRARE